MTININSLLEQMKVNREMNPIRANIPDNRVNNIRRLEEEINPEEDIEITISYKGRDLSHKCSWTYKLISSLTREAFVKKQRQDFYIASSYLVKKLQEEIV